MSAKPVATVNHSGTAIVARQRRHLRRAVVLATLASSMWASTAGASVGAAHSLGTSNQEDPTFAVGQRAFTFVDPSGPTPAGNGEPAALTRTMETLVLYPARGKVGGAAVSEAPPADGLRFPVVVFLHGSAGTGEDYRETLERWAAAGYVVAAPTMPLGGHGVQGVEALVADRSNHPDDVRFVLSELAHELPRALRRITNLDRVAIVGKSLGAATAIEVAFDPAHTDDRIRAAVLIAEPGSSDRTPDGVEWITVDLAAGNRVPVLFVHGEADEVFAYDGSRANFETARAPKFLLTLVGASHAPTLSIDVNAPVRQEVEAARGPIDRIGPADDAVILGTLDFLDRYAGSDKHALTRLRQNTNVPGVARLESSQRF